MKNGRINIGSIRREQIVAAAVAVIAEQGIQHLSLSEIEKKVGMSRGQLTYYYKTKEDILLAVFDRLLQLMCEQQGEEPLHQNSKGKGRPVSFDPSASKREGREGSNGTPSNGEGRMEHPFANLPWLEVVRCLLDMILQDPPAHPEFHALQHTFLSQISHREDFRLKLAELYEEWRGNMVHGLTRDLKERPSGRKVSPRALATLVQAILHGLAVQKAADPAAVDTREVTQLCLDMLAGYLWESAPPVKERKKATNKQPAVRRRTPVNRIQVPHERNGK